MGTRPNLIWLSFNINVYLNMTLCLTPAIAGMRVPLKEEHRNAHLVTWETLVLVQLDTVAESVLEKREFLRSRHII